MRTERVPLSPGRFLCVSTVSAADGSPLGQAAHLIDSLRRQDATFTLVLVVRDSEATRVETIDAQVVLLHVPRALSSSASRNCGLGYAVEAGLMAAAEFVIFPDDDSSLPPELLARVARSFDDEPSVGVLVGRYGPSETTVNEHRFPAEPGLVTTANADSLVSSATLFLRRRVAERVGFFDERFGLNATHGSSEDLDFGLRALDISVGLYRPELFVQHEYKSGNPARYYPGNLALAAKRARHSRADAWRLLGVLRVGLRRVRAGEMTWSVLMKSFVGALPCLAYKKTHRHAVLRSP